MRVCVRMRVYVCVCAHLMRWLLCATSIVVCDWVAVNMATMDGCTTMGGWNLQCDFVVYNLH